MNFPMNSLLEKNKDKIVVVTKNHSLDEIKVLYDEGFRIFGENRVQELVSKQKNDMPGIQWQLIGHLQTNKVKYAVKYCSLIQSVDSLKLLQDINKEAHKQNKLMPVLIQVNIAQEETKFGISIEELGSLLKESSNLDHIIISGLMVIGPHTKDTAEIKKVFTQGKELFDKYQNFQQSNVNFTILSMGMSEDYPFALECGSTMLRLGRIMFGVKL